MSYACDSEESYNWDSDGEEKGSIVYGSGLKISNIGIERECIPSSSRVGWRSDSEESYSWDIDEDMETSPAKHYSACEDDDTNDDFSDNEDSSEILEDQLCKGEKTISTLKELGFTADEASLAFNLCGPDASILDLADSICAAQMAVEPLSPKPNSDIPRRAYPSNKVQKKKHEKRGKFMRKRVHAVKNLNHVKKKRVENDTALDNNNDDRLHSNTIYIPNPMIGFSLPDVPQVTTLPKLPEDAIGPPYFYYENVALAPPGAWETMSRFLYDIQPEFVDSKFFCATARKRGYIHNLPVTNRFPLHPAPPKTIQDALPATKKWWPSWDLRTQLNCIQTCIASATILERIRLALSESTNPPHVKLQKEILKTCRIWNLVWVGHNKVAPLEPHEMELLLGFPVDHTRGAVSRTERYRSLGNSFQVDTVAFHLSVLKRMFPNGMNVLSLFSGIGGAEVALDRLGIKLNTVVSVEMSEGNRNIVRSWWEQTNQTGTLIEYGDVGDVGVGLLEDLIGKYGGFDLVIGGSPCNNLAGSNRHHRDGLDGAQSSLFFEYYRILDLVKCLMERR